MENILNLGRNHQKCTSCDCAINKYVNRNDYLYGNCEKPCCGVSACHYPKIGRCTRCISGNINNGVYSSPTYNSIASLIVLNNQIYNNVRVPSSQYINSLSANTIYQQSRYQNNVNWNQSSDRCRKHIMPNPNPSRGNSLRRSLTRNRPGSLRPGGEGVDIKHNSYARYLGRKKGKALQPQSIQQNIPNTVVNNKFQKGNILKNFNLFPNINCNCCDINNNKDLSQYIYNINSSIPYSISNNTVDLGTNSLVSEKKHRILKLVEVQYP